MNTRALLAAQLAGLILILGGFAGFAYWQRTPAIVLQHDDPHSRLARSGPFGFPGELNPLRLLAASPYAQNVREQPRPSQPHRGLWIEIPSLQIALPIEHGDGSNQIPQWVALTYPGTAAPGSNGNSYIYAHGLWGMFGALLFARPGDAVLLHNYDTGKVQAFHVTRVVGRVAYNDDTWMHARSSTPLLTLQTCVDFDPRGDRFIVLAD